MFYVDWPSGLWLKGATWMHNRHSWSEPSIWWMDSCLMGEWMAMCSLFRKFTLLFVIASLTSMVCAHCIHSLCFILSVLYDLIWFQASFVAQIFFENQTFLIPDQLINVGCLYLQFKVWFIYPVPSAVYIWYTPWNMQFTNGLYMKCCSPCHRVTEWSIALQIKTLLFADSVANAVTNVLPVSAVTDAVSSLGRTQTAQTDSKSETNDAEKEIWCTKFGKACGQWVVNPQGRMGQFYDEGKDGNDDYALICEWVRVLSCQCQ